SEIRLLRDEPDQHALCQTAHHADRLFAAPRRLVHGSRRRGQVARRSARGVVGIRTGEDSASKLDPEIALKSNRKLHLASRGFSSPEARHDIESEMKPWSGILR